MDDLKGQERTLKVFFTEHRYGIDFYQREYKWQREHVADLMADLLHEFNASFEPTHSRGQVARYGIYFLGSIILSSDDDETKIVDGQQRITTLMLLLIALMHAHPSEDERAEIMSLLRTTEYGKRSYSVNVEERHECVEALFAGRSFHTDEPNLSVENMVARYSEIQKTLEDKLGSEEIAFFADWLLQRVMLVRIMASSGAEAYRVFETMNDRGLKITDSEMLLGYLLYNAPPESREPLHDKWRSRVNDLRPFGHDEDDEAIRAWLRSQHASTSTGYRSAASGDYERIGSAFHRWVRESAKELKLIAPEAFESFIDQDFAFYARWYCRLRDAAREIREGLDCVRYLGTASFTPQFMVLLAPLSPNDPDDTALSKVRASAACLDILVHSRVWNHSAVDQRVLRYPLFELIKVIRRKELADLVPALEEFLSDRGMTFATKEPFRRNQQNGQVVHRVLARLTDHVTPSATTLPHKSAGAESYFDLVQTGPDGFDVEHILPEVFDSTVAGFTQESEYESERNWIGGLLLLPSSVNRSIQDMPYAEKREHYVKENDLAASLHELAYDRNPKFRALLKDKGLPFKSYEQFGKAELHERQQLYEQIAAQVWSPERIRVEAGF